MYLNACRALVQIESAQAEFSVIDEKKIPEIASLPGGANLADGATKIQHSEMLCRGLFKGLMPVLVEDKKSNLFLWDTNVTNYEQGKTMPSMKMLFAGNPRYHRLSKEGKLIPERRPKPDDDRDYLSVTRMMNARFGVGAFPSYSPQFQEFGRIQGTSAIGTNLWKLWLDAGKNRSRLAAMDLRSWVQKNPEKSHSYQISGTVVYDNGCQASVVEVTVDGQVGERFWIDSSRGYICPLAQVVVGGKTMFERRASDFVQDTSSHLWYPTKYRYKTPNMLREGASALSDDYNYSEFTLIPDSLVLNKKLPDGLFALDMTSGEEISDSRIGGDTVFVARGNGALSFKNGDIDLRSLSWLEEKGTAYSGDRTVKVAQAAEYTWTRIILISSGLLLILIALSVILYRKWKGR
ncbi:hypothetical protein FACS189419_04740 [Planctomycetales bacterium]|nr:hypothetical protein FACS189419_04740 [Planctomycetales bacterium]